MMNLPSLFALGQLHPTQIGSWWLSAAQLLLRSIWLMTSNALPCIICTLLVVAIPFIPRFLLTFQRVFLFLRRQQMIPRVHPSPLYLWTVQLSLLFLVGLFPCRITLYHRPMMIVRLCIGAFLAATVQMVTLFFL